MAALLAVIAPASPAGAAELPPVFDTKWGSYGSGVGQFNFPDGVAVDSSGNVYVVDRYNHRIQKFTSAGVYITQWGTYGPGNGQFKYPTGVAVDGAGNVYVADYSNNRIQKFTSAGVFVTTWSGSGSANGGFSGPSSVAVDGSGNVYVADEGNYRIQVFTSSGVFVTKWGTEGTGDGQFSGLRDMAVDGSGNVYVFDRESFGSVARVQKFTSSGSFVTKWGTLGSGDGQFNGAGFVAVDGSGNVYVADTSNYRVQKFTSSGSFVTKWGTRGTGNGQFEGPSHVAVDASGNVFVVDTNNHRIQKFAPAAPSLSTVKTADESSVVVGETVHLHVKVTNTGNVALTNVTITDANATTCQAAPFSLAVGADRTVDCTHVATESEVSGGYHNTASVTSTEVTTPVVSNTVNVTVTPAPAPALSVVKSVDESSVVVGEAIHYDVTVENTGNVALSGVSLSDANANCDPVAATLAVDAEDTVECSHVAVEADVGNYPNTATGDSDQTAAVVSNEVSTTVVAVAPSLSVEKSVDESSVDVGETIHYDVTVENTGNVALSGVELEDANATCDPVATSLAVGADDSVECTHVATAGDVGTYVNTASASSTEVTTPVASNEVSTTVTIPAGDGVVSGTVTEAGSGDAIPGALVAALSTIDFSFVDSAVADGEGDYALVAPEGDYYLYLLDPVGAHRPGFHGSPTTVSVTNGATSDADPQMAATTGSIAGTITEDGTGDPLPGALAVAINGSTSQPGRGDVTDGSGGFVIDGVPTGNHFGVFVDLAGAHRPEFFDNRPSPASLDAISVSGAATAGPVDAALAPQTPPSGGAHLTGTVTADGGGPALEGVAVIALHAATYQVAAGDLTDADGAYDIGLDPGSYRIEYLDVTGQYRMEWHDDLAFNQMSAASAVTVAAGDPTVIDADLTSATGTVTGTVTESGSGDPLGQVWVIAMTAAGVDAATVTGPDGTYTLTGLAAGPHRIRFIDTTNGHIAEYHGGTTGYPSNPTVTVTGGSTANHTDAALDPLDE